MRSKQQRIIIEGCRKWKEVKMEKTVEKNGKRKRETKKNVLVNRNGKFIWIKHFH